MAICLYGNGPMAMAMAMAMALWLWRGNGLRMGDMDSGGYEGVTRVM
jgi:hypothetical protein